ncbi:DUF1858 domain-containing protein [Wukongibacter baidiensis]|uniref:DUF1858 domain-containing protein n=1 Tax=Wukongibacter baidiensis TaxID=1723361 RepID=UPI003D7FB515
MRYNKDMTIAEILFTNPNVLEVFKKYGLHCQHCFGAETETLEIASRVNGINLEEILFDLESLE